MNVATDLSYRSLASYDNNIYYLNVLGQSYSAIYRCELLTNGVV